MILLAGQHQSHEVGQRSHLDPESVAEPLLELGLTNCKLGPIACPGTLVKPAPALPDTVNHTYKDEFVRKVNMMCFYF